MSPSDINELIFIQMRIFLNSVFRNNKIRVTLAVNSRFEGAIYRSINKLLVPTTEFGDTREATNKIRTSLTQSEFDPSIILVMARRIGTSATEIR